MSYDVSKMMGHERTADGQTQFGYPAFCWAKERNIVASGRVLHAGVGTFPCMCLRCGRGVCPWILVVDILAGC